MRRWKNDIQPVFGETATLHTWAIRAVVAAFFFAFGWLTFAYSLPAPFYGSWPRAALHCALYLNAGALLFAAWWLRDHSSIKTRDAISALVGFGLALTPTAFLLFGGLNRVLDFHAPEVVRREILGTRASHGFYAIVELPDGPADLRIDAETYRSLASNGAVEIEIHPGAFGHPWIRDYVVTPR